jgi:hypothetical protein
MKIALEEYDLHRALDSSIFLTSKFSPRHLARDLTGGCRKEALS